MSKGTFQAAVLVLAGFALTVLAYPWASKDPAKGEESDIPVVVMVFTLVGGVLIIAGLVLAVRNALARRWPSEADRPR